MGIGIVTGIVVARSGVTLMARIRGVAGALMTQASLTSITWTVSDLTLGTQAGTGTFAVASVVFDSLQQTDPRWTMDSAGTPGRDGSFGYNFLATLANTLFPVTTLVALGRFPQTAPDLFQADVVFQPVTGDRFTVPYQFQPIEVFA